MHSQLLTTNVYVYILDSAHRFWSNFHMELEIDFTRDTEQKKSTMHSVRISYELKHKLLEIWGSGEKISEQTRKFWKYAIQKWEAENKVETSDSA